MTEPVWTKDDALFMHLINDHDLGQWQAHGDPVLMHAALHAHGVADHDHEDGHL